MSKIHLARIFADHDGESHFGARNLLMAPRQYAPPAPPLNVGTVGLASQVVLLGGDSDWGGDEPHTTPTTQLMCVLSGRIEITTSDGDKHEFSLGDLFILEDTYGKGHSTRFLVDGVLVAAIGLSDSEKEVFELDR